MPDRSRSPRTETLSSRGRHWFDKAFGRHSELRRHAPFDRFPWLIAGVPVLLIVGTAALLVSRPQGHLGDPNIFTVQRGDVTIKITERGELRALDSVTISAQKDYPIVYLVPEGTVVEEGELLVALDSSKYEAELEEVKAALQVAKADLQKAENDFQAQGLKLQAGIARYDADLRIAQLEMDELKKKPLPHERDRAINNLENAKLAYANAASKRDFMPSLVEKGFVTRASLERAELEYMEAKAKLSAAQFEHDQVLAGATPQELQRAQIRLDQATIALEKATSGMLSELQSYEATVARARANVQREERLVDTGKIRLGRTSMHAPRAGIVVYAPAGDGSADKVQLGMIPYEGQPILYLPDLSKMAVDTQVNEIDIGKLSLDATVEVRVEAFPQAVFHGKVMEIGSLAKLKSSPSGAASGVKAFDVTVLIEGQDTRLKPGLTVTLDIVVDHQEDVLSVPLAAVTSRRGEQVVFVSKPGRVEKRNVELGMSNEHIVIVTQGLEPGERVLVNRPPS